MVSLEVPHPSGARPHQDTLHSLDHQTLRTSSHHTTHLRSSHEDHLPGRTPLRVCPPSVLMDRTGETSCHSVYRGRGNQGFGVGPKKETRERDELDLTSRTPSRPSSRGGMSPVEGRRGLPRTGGRKSLLRGYRTRHRTRGGRGGWVGSTSPRM